VWLYEQYVTALLQLYEKHCPGYCAILALVSVERNLYRLFNWSIGYYGCLSISPIVHPQQWDPNDPELTRITIPHEESVSGVHPLLASISSFRVPQISLETALFFLRYLRSGGHSVKTQKSLKPLLKPSYFMRLKMRPWLSRFRKRQNHHSNGYFVVDERRLYSEWWGNYQLPHGSYSGWKKNRIPVPLRFTSYRLQYASNYDLWYTYRYALLLLPFFLANAPPDSQLASIAADFIFNSFCTAYPWETRRAKGSIKQYLSRCRSIRGMPLVEKSVVHGMNSMDID